MFYGRYSDKVLVIGGERTFYNMPLAYFMVGCVSFLVILLSILWRYELSADIETRRFEAL